MIIYFIEFIAQTAAARKKNAICNHRAGRGDTLQLVRSSYSVFFNTHITLWYMKLSEKAPHGVQSPTETDF